MRSAAQYDQFPTLMATLQEEASLWAHTYASLDGDSALARTSLVWKERVEETGRLLIRLAERANTLA